MTMTYTQLLIYLVSGIVCGYVLFLFILKTLPQRLHAGRLAQKREILDAARKHAESIKQEAIAADQAKYQLLKEEIESGLNDRMEDLKMSESELETLEQQINPLTARVQKLETETHQVAQHAEFARSVLTSTEAKHKEITDQLVKELEARAQSESAKIIKNLTDQLAETRQLETQKILKLHTEELSTSAKRIASRFLGRSLARYSPEFPWPKASNTVEVENSKHWDTLQADTHGLLAQMRELAGIQSEFIPARFADMPALIKLSGGMGLEREAARLALSELLKPSSVAWNRGQEFYDRFKAQLEQQAIKLGRQAINELQLPDIHIEVVKLVGALNWRTSYRQNQFLHSFEVGLLAGLVAEELGVDPVLAKRCGLLHDIGKVLDYRIEGSHAVISGDYADRFGESKLICDTLMSHHNDLVLETPLAHVLKTADTLSGARPGARVNLEEGYQDRLSAIDDVIRGFPGVTKSAIMNGGREIHIEVNHKRVRDEELAHLTNAIAKKIESDVAFPGQIKVMVSRRFESSSVA